MTDVVLRGVELRDFAGRRAGKRCGPQTVADVQRKKDRPIRAPTASSCRTRPCERLRTLRAESENLQFVGREESECLPSGDQKGCVAPSVAGSRVAVVAARFRTHSAPVEPSRADTNATFDPSGETIGQSTRSPRAAAAIVNRTACRLLRDGQ